MVWEIKTSMLWCIILFMSSCKLTIPVTCNPTTDTEMTVRLDNLQVAFEKHELKIDSYEEKNGMLEVRTTWNDMQISKLQGSLKKLTEKTNRIDTIQTNIELLERQNSENEAKIGLIDSMENQLHILERKNADNEAQISKNEKNIAMLEGKMVKKDALEARLDRLEEKCAEKDKDIDNLKELNAKNEEQMDKLHETNSKNEKIINHYQVRINQLEEQLCTFKAKISLVENTQIKIDHDEKKNSKQLSNRLDDMEVKMEHVTTKIDSSIESQELSTSVLEEKWAKHEEEIIKINANCIRRISGDSQTSKNVPSSCKELAIKGHPFDGLYLVKNSDTKNIEAVLCNFENTDVSQALIGNVDIKMKSVHFYVQRTSNFGFFGSVIPFEVARLNEGGAFNLASGMFTAPVAGIYNFQLTAVKNPTVAILWIYLQLNGINVGIAGTSQGFTGSFGTVSLSSSLRLRAGDRVNLFHAGGILFDNTERYTHFTGSLVKEDMA